MKKVWFLFALITLTLAAYAGQLVHEGDPLPRGFAPFEKGLPLPRLDYHTDPPSQAVRATGEWEEVQGILVRWPYSSSWNTLWANFLTPVADDVRIYMIVSSYSDTSSIKSFLASNGCPTDSVIFMQRSTNSVWIRDYGPWWIWQQNTWDRAIVDWDYNRPRPLDDAIPEWLATYFGVDYYGPDITHTGGNFMVDGWKSGFASELTYSENSGMTPSEINQIFEDYMNLDTVNYFPEFYGIDHIDMSMKFLNDHTVIVNEYPDGSSYNDDMDDCIAILETLTDPYGRPLDIVRIPAPEWYSTPYTYTNSLIVNNTVLVPIYNRTEDAQALRLYEEYMPGYEIYGFDCNSIIGSSGAIHCVTKDVIHPHLIRIEHPPMADTVTTAGPYTIAARIVSLGTLDTDSLIVYWSTDGIWPWNSAPMSATAADSFAAEIPAQAVGTDVRYLIYAKNTQGNWTHEPRYGPDAHHRFYVDIEPAAPRAVEDLVISPDAPDIVLHWSPVTEDINGLPITVSQYH
ncbi:agmatine deiminase family protein, partial [bacterium]|nr:agmatine deiminase family protein [bacterium]